MTSNSPDSQYPLTKLPVEIYERIVAIAEQGDALAEQSAYKAAIAKYNEAWQAIPEPKSDWEASTWLLAAIGDACFLGGYYESGLEAFSYALHCPGGFGNPFIHLRLGQCALERGDRELAAEHLCRAYALEGQQIFANDPSKYFEFLMTQIEPPVGG